MAKGDLTEKVYSFGEAFESSKKSFKGDEMAARVWISKYALKDTSKQKNSKDLDNIILYEKNPDQMHKRLAREIAKVENKYPNSIPEDQIYNLLKDFKYLVPQGGPMSGIGNNNQIVSLSNCFVIGNKGHSDSYGGIMKIDQEQVQLMKRRGGVGHDLSHIRPKGSAVKNSALTSTGVVPFMERYSNSTKEVAQDGRRGALMLSIDIKHPDAENFIDAKLEQGKITGANISVKIDDDFMNAVKNEKKYIQQYPIDSENPSFTKKVDAKKIWDKIVHNAWKSAEPGILFWDTIINESVPDCYAGAGAEKIDELKIKYNGNLEDISLEDEKVLDIVNNLKSFKTVSTNPCGEIPLCPYDSCRLFAVNLYNYVENPFTKDAKFNFPLFKEHVGYAQKFSDDIIDLEIEKIDSILNKIGNDPEEEEVKIVEKNLWKNIKHKAEEGRRNGLGITAEGDMLAALGLKYGSEKAIDFSEEVHKTMALSAYRTSVEMVKEGRKPFAIYDFEKEKDNPFMQRLFNEDPKLEEDMKKYGRRNIALLTIAPTGTTSMMTQTTSGLENIFLPVYERKTKVNPNDKNAIVHKTDDEGIPWQMHKVFHDKFNVWLEANNYDVEKVKKIANESINDKEKEKELNEIIEKSPYYGATSEDVDWVAKVKMQGAVQKWVDHSISVTVNLPPEADEELVGNVYMAAWENGCKGVTVYRDGSREGVLTSGKKNGDLEEITLVQKNVKPDPRIDIKPQAIKYKVTRSEDSLHFILTSNLYVDDEKKKAYFIPDEDFQVRAPSGMAASVSFSQSGIDRTEALRNVSPNYVEMVSRLQSVYSNELEGVGPRVIKSIEHSAGLVFEDYFLRNGIIGKDEHTGKLTNLIQKDKLRKVKKESDEYKAIISQVNLDDSEEEISINGNNGKLGEKFSCEGCGGTHHTTINGCSNPVCKDCGWSNPDKSCG
jgi:ribonucleoside-diphosphate reductase alpha chain